MGKKTQQNFLYIDVSKVQRKNPKQVLLLLVDMYLSLSYALYISERVCQMRNTHPLFILFLPLDFFHDKLAPTNLLGQLHLGRHKTYYTIFRRVLLTRLTMEVLTHDSMMTKYNSNISTNE